MNADKRRWLSIHLRSSAVLYLLFNLMSMVHHVRHSLTSADFVSRLEVIID